MLLCSRCRFRTLSPANFLGEQSSSSSMGAQGRRPLRILQHESASKGMTWDQPHSSFHLAHK